MSKKNVLWIMLLTVMVSALIYGWQFNSRKHMDYYAEAFSADMSFANIFDMDIIDSKTMQIKGEDPYIVYELPETKVCLRCKLVFDSAVLDTPPLFAYLLCR